MKFMLVRKCRCPGITEYKAGSIVYTKKFMDIVERRRNGKLSIKYAAEEAGISTTCLLNREKDCLKYIAELRRNQLRLKHLDRGDKAC